MNIKKPLLVAGVVSGVAFSSLAGASLVAADTGTTGTDSSGPTALIEKLSSKFNLNKEEVSAVFEEERAARQAERQQAYEARLTQAVADGKLTSEQKNKLVAKVKEVKADMQANREAAAEKTHEERHAAMETKRAELEKWAADNDIPTEYLHPGGGMGGRGHGPRM
jgi:hypothetical protein